MISNLEKKPLNSDDLVFKLRMKLSLEFKKCILYVVIMGMAINPLQLPDAKIRIGEVYYVRGLTMNR